MYDVRDVANFVISASEDKKLKITNLSLQKLLYFCHGWYFANFERPLIKSKFEAWQYGPVQRVIYDQFKRFGRTPINGQRATFLDPLTGNNITRAPSLNDIDAHMVLSVLDRYKDHSASQLVEESHAEDGPWEFVWKQAEQAIYPGMKIPDELILLHFKRLPVFSTSH